MKNRYRCLIGIIGILAICALCAMLFMVGDGSSKAGGEIIFEMPEVRLEKRGIKLRIFGYKADSINLIAIENILKQFMREHDDVTIIYEGVKGRPYWDALERRERSGLLDEIFMIDHDHLLQYEKEGILADLSGIDGIYRFQKWVRDQFTEPSGAVLFLPACISAYAMWINYDLLKAQGFGIPATWDEFARICEHFVSRGITPIIANNYLALPELASARALFPLYKKGDFGEVLHKFNSGRADIAESMRPGLEMLGIMLDRGWIDRLDSLKTRQTANDLVAFAKGERPFMVTGGWASPRIKALKPAFAYGAHPFPILPDGGVVQVEVNTCVSVNAASPHKEIINSFAEYITRPEVLQQYADSQSSFSPSIDSTPPPDEKIASLAEAITSGRIAVFPDYRLKIHLRGALVEVCEAMLRGMGAEAAVARLDFLLKKEAAE